MLIPAWGGQLSRLIGAAQVSLPGALLFLLLALSLIGIPPLPGFWAKFLLVKGALEIGNDWYYLAIGVVLIATVIKTAYFLRIVRLMFQQQSKQVVETPQTSELTSAFTFVTILLISILTIGPIGKSLTAVAEEAADRKAYLTNTLPVWHQSFQHHSVQ